MLLTKSSIRSSHGRKHCNYVADFETITRVDDCRVWLWGLIEVSDNCTQDDMVYGTDIESFIFEVSNRFEDVAIYFHNLAFDGYFILDYLLNSGFVHTTGKLAPGTFSTLISRAKKFYSMRVMFLNGKTVEFRDSLKKLPMSVEAIAKTFDLPFSKLFMDYHEMREIGHKPTPDELKYLASDLTIVARALDMQFKEGMKKLTVGSDSLFEFKSLFGSKTFLRAFPVLDKHMDKEIRMAYRGGWTYWDPRFAREVVGPGSVYDVNSLYPSIMYYKPMPFDVPRWFTGPPKFDPQFPLFIVSITFTAKLKKNHLPTIQVKSHPVFFETEYVTEIPEPETMVVTNVDLELWQKHYDMDIHSFNGGWKFRAFTGFFKSYIDKWTKVKQESTGGKRAIAKLHLNSLYGKFATNPDITGKIPYMGENNTVKLKLSDPEERNPVYTAVGVFITAYGRATTITAAQANYDSFAYADTDSIHLLTQDKPNGIIVGKELGQWGHEYDFDYAKFWRAKTYIERKQGSTPTDAPTYETHVAGLPAHVQRDLRIGDFEAGRVFYGKLLPKHVPGGIVLTDETYSLK